MPNLQAWDTTRAVDRRTRLGGESGQRADEANGNGSRQAVQTQRQTSAGCDEGASGQMQQREQERVVVMLAVVVVVEEQTREGSRRSNRGRGRETQQQQRADGQQQALHAARVQLGG
jgi:hypothetical protein